VSSCFTLQSLPSQLCRYLFSLHGVRSSLVLLQTRSPKTQRRRSRWPICISNSLAARTALSATAWTASRLARSSSTSRTPSRNEWSVIVNGKVPHLARGVGRAAFGWWMYNGVGTRPSELGPWFSACCLVPSVGKRSRPSPNRTPHELGTRKAATHVAVVVVVVVLCLCCVVLCCGLSA
jgi:hypothetical protein